METIGDQWIIEEIERLRREQNPAKYRINTPQERPSLPTDESGGRRPPEQPPETPGRIEISLN